MPMHDWTRVEAGIYHAFHGPWLLAIARALNNGLLPPSVYAPTEQRLADFETDVLTLQLPLTTSGPPSEDGATPARPAVGVLEREAKVPRRRAGRRLTIRHVSNHRVVAVVELVSPGNTDSRPHLAEFVAKAAALLTEGIHLLVIDPFPPPTHAPNGLHAAIWKKVTRPRKGRKPFTPPADRPLLAASYCASVSDVTAAVQTFAVGEPVPDIPLYLTADEDYVTIPLEATYAAAFPDVPRVWRDVLEA
jgi:hypothetical protein